MQRNSLIIQIVPIVYALKLLATITIALIVILAIPVSSPHISHTGVIYHILLHGGNMISLVI